jgi:hypothetical protein
MRARLIATGKVAAAVTLVALVALAGCSGGRKKDQRRRRSIVTA